MVQDYVLGGQVLLRLEVGVLLLALRFEPNIGWSERPTGICAWVRDNEMKVSYVYNSTYHCWSLHF